MNKIKEIFPTIYPLFITIPTMIIFGFIIGFLIIGCEMNNKAEIGKNAEVGKNATVNISTTMDSLANINAIYSETPLATGKIDLSKSDDFKLLLKDIKELKEFNQTNNTGFMSGGAPWLFMVIILILYGNKHLQYSKTKKEVEKHRDTIHMQQETIRTLSARKAKEAKIQSIVDKIRNTEKNEKRQESRTKQGVEEGK